MMRSAICFGYPQMDWPKSSMAIFGDLNTSALNRVMEQATSG
jgi:hypothetical protein